MVGDLQSKAIAWGTLQNSVGPSCWLFSLPTNLIQHLLGSPREPGGAGEKAISHASEEDKEIYLVLLSSPHMAKHTKQGLRERRLHCPISPQSGNEGRYIQCIQWAGRVYGQRDVFVPHIWRSKVIFH